MSAVSAASPEAGAIISLITPQGRASAQRGLVQLSGTLNGGINYAVAGYNRARDAYDAATPRTGVGYYLAQGEVAGLDLLAGGVSSLARGVAALPGAAAHPLTTGYNAIKAVANGIDKVALDDRPALQGLRDGFAAASSRSIRQNAFGVGEVIATVGTAVVPFLGEARGAAAVAELGEAGAVGGRLAVVERGLAAESEVAAGVKAYPDGSLRTADGKFASVSGVPAPGTASASRFADFLSSNGVDVVGQELEVNGMLGVRRYDIVTRNADGTLHGLEIKTGGATRTPYQDFTDMHVNRFGATGRGRIDGQTMTGTSVVYLPGGY